MCIDLLAITVGDGRTRPNPKGVEMQYGKMNPLFTVELSRYDLGNPGRATEQTEAERTCSAPGRVASWKRLVRMLPFEDLEPVAKGDRGDLNPG